MRLKPSLFKIHGIGVGLRGPHQPLFTRPADGARPVDWVELISDNLIPGARLFNTGARQTALRVREHYPVALHGVSMSLGSATGVDRDYLAKIRALADELDPIVVSDHLCWTQVDGRQTHDLNPLPYTESMIHQVVTQISRVQDALGRRILVENLSSYVTFEESEMGEAEFLAEIARLSDCGILLDLNNVYVSAINHGFDPREYLRALPAERVGQLHLAGHSNRNGFLVDTHDEAVCLEVWALYDWYGREFGHASAMIERDARIPAWEELALEVDRLRAGFRPFADAHAPKSGSPSSALPPPPEMLEVGRIAQRQSQNQWVDAILGRGEISDIRGDRKLGAQERFAIYEDGFWGRIQYAIAVDFVEFKAAVGEHEFEACVRRAIGSDPPSSADLNDLSLKFHDRLCQEDHPHLDEARRDWARALACLGRGLPMPSACESRFELLSTENPEHFDRICLVFHPSLQILEGQRTVFWFDSGPREMSFGPDEWPAILALLSRLPLADWGDVPAITPERLQAWTEEGLIRGYQKIAQETPVEITARP